MIVSKDESPHWIEVELGVPEQNCAVWAYTCDDQLPELAFWQLQGDMIVWKAGMPRLPGRTLGGISRWAYVIDTETATQTILSSAG